MAKLRSQASRNIAVAALASIGWVAAWACLVKPAGSIHADALHYLDMVRGPLSRAPAPFCFRVGAPLLARVLPVPAEAGLYLTTLLSLGLASGLWVWVGRRLGLSGRSLAMAALAAGSTQGWVGYFSNPYLTDGPGLLGLMAAFAAWACDAFWLGLLVLAVGPLFRETMAPMSLLWARGGQWRRLGLAMAASAVPLLVVHSLPDMPAGAGAFSVAREVLETKGPLRILGDAFASYHALWLVALLGLAVAPAGRRKVIAPPLMLLLAVACALSVVALNTVRMFTLALPLMSLAAAEFFEALARRQPRGAWALALLFAVGGLVWFPTRPLGTLVSSHKGFQYLFVAAALAGTVVACATPRRLFLGEKAT